MMFMKLAENILCGIVCKTTICFVFFFNHIVSTFLSIAWYNFVKYSKSHVIYNQFKSYQLLSMMDFDFVFLFFQAVLADVTTLKVIPLIQLTLFSQWRVSWVFVRFLWTQCHLRKTEQTRCTKDDGIVFASCISRSQFFAQWQFPPHGT